VACAGFGIAPQSGSEVPGFAGRIGKPVQFRRCPRNGKDGGCGIGHWIKTIREGAASDPAKPGNQPWTTSSCGGRWGRGMPRLGSVHPVLCPSPARGVAGGVNEMCVTRILDGLEACESIGAEADAVARLGFMEWVFSETGAVTATVARDALDCPAARNAASPAAQAFVGFLQQAGCNGALSGAGRRRRRAAAWH